MPSLQCLKNKVYRSMYFQAEITNQNRCTGSDRFNYRLGNEHVSNKSLRRGTLMKVLDKPSMKTFEKMESEVRSYIRSFNKVFVKAKESKDRDVDGKQYIDFFVGAGALNDRHQNIGMKAKDMTHNK